MPAPPHTASKIERGKSVPGGETILKLIGVLETTAPDLYEGIVWDADRGVFVVAPA